MERDYFNHLAGSLERLLNAILKEEGLGLFRRPLQVVAGSSLDSHAGALQLFLLGKSMERSNQGTFNSATSGDRFTVFRNPIPMKTSFLLTGLLPTSREKLRIYDKLVSYFFDHRTLAPFIPDSYRNHPALYERMNAQNAEIQLSPEVSTEPNLRLHFAFDYVALYHSGNPMRDELRTKTRVFEYPNDEKERTVL